MKKNKIELNKMIKFNLIKILIKHITSAEFLVKQSEKLTSVQIRAKAGKIYSKVFTTDKNYITQIQIKFLPN